MGKRRADKEQSKLNMESFKRVRLGGEEQNINLVKPTESNKKNVGLIREECEKSHTKILATKGKHQCTKKTKRKKKKKNSKPVGDGIEANLACLKYLSEWKDDKESWKFEKIKQNRLTTNMFDKGKLPDEYFNVFLEYMEKTSKSMKQLLISKANEVIFNVEKWNDLSDQDKLTTPKPKYYDVYSRARDLLQCFD